MVSRPYPINMGAYTGLGPWRTVHSLYLKLTHNYVPGNLGSSFIPGTQLCIQVGIQMLQLIGNDATYIIDY